MTASEPVPTVDPALETLTFEQLAQLVNEISPEVFYERARAFDAAVTRLEQVQDDLAHATRELWDAWRGAGADSFAEAVREVSAQGNTVIQALASPGCGATLRRAGEALTLAQQRIRDLQAQKREGDLQAARQIVHELGIAYQEVGAAITPLPGAEIGIAANDQGVLPAASTGATPVMGGVRLPIEGDAGRFGDSAGTHGGGAIVPLMATVPSNGSLPAGEADRHGDARPGALDDSDNCASQHVVPAVLGKGMPVAPVVPGETGDVTLDGREAGALVAVLGRPGGTQAATRDQGRKKPRERSEGESTASESDESRVTPKAPNADITSHGPSTRAGSVPKVEVAASAGPIPADAPATVPASPEPVKAPAHATATVASPPAPATPAAPSALPGTATTPAEIGKTHPLPPGSGAGLPGNATPVTPGVPVGDASLPGALPASPAFRPVTGAFDASSTIGLTPVIPGGGGPARIPGETMHGAAGGFMAPMLGGAHETDNDRQPAGLLGVDPKIWEGSGSVPHVLGRRASAPLAESSDLDAAKKKAMDMVDSVLGRSEHKEDDPAAE
ncbi:hypothetical protein SD37_09665 [Amycolatopsis orientalis]|uniref:WXG100 family type VII secretion target n=1 Tax=Amycolatopsis orientalis TaxID=31958 RepID=A0A193BUN2_AMYOR|nr:WXG100 family type VII secretion target [Amycolatopsis orientalis]ANN15884.1 hypothetical protein SD37_09665 [Amycolatopsis orientalis]